MIDEVKLLAALVPIVELYNVGVVKPGQDLDLIQHSLGISLERLLLDALQASTRVGSVAWMECSGVVGASQTYFDRHLDFGAVRWAGPGGLLDSVWQKIERLGLMWVGL